MIVQRCWVRAIHAFCFSLNVAFGAVLLLEYGYDGVFVPIYRLEQLLYRQLGIVGAGGAISGYLAFFLWVLALTAFLYATVFCFRKTRLIEAALASAGGFLALGVAPSCWFYINRASGWTWYPAETIACLGLAVLYLSTACPLPTYFVFTIACFHFTFWYLRFSEHTHSAAHLLTPIVGLFACITWGIYIHKAGAQPRRDTPT